ncbi:MAG: DUF3606 domain-containing protein [Bacteroidia bacterium]|nr:DUF3606 domain-containing protein [Bacteroidia bacterium]
MDNLENKGPEDRSLIALKEDWEVKWWTKSLGVSVLQLKEAIDAVGYSSEKVHLFLQDKKHLKK